MSDFLRPHRLQHVRLPCPPLSPGVCWRSRPLSQWCHLTVLSSATPSSFCLESFPASGSFPMSWLFTSGDPSIEASASASVLPTKIQVWFPCLHINLHNYIYTLKAFPLKSRVYTYMSSATNPQITFSFLPRFLLILLHRSKFSLGSSPHYCFFVHFSISSLIQHLLGGVVKCLRCTHCMQNKFSAPLFTHHLNEETKRCPYIQNFHSVSAPWTGKLWNQALQSLLFASHSHYTGIHPYTM